MELSGGVIMLGSPSREYQNPRHHAEVCDHARAWLSTPFVVDGVLVYVDDIDAHFERAQALGATVLSPIRADWESEVIAGCGRCGPHGFALPSLAYEYLDQWVLFMAGLSSLLQINEALVTHTHRK